MNKLVISFLLFFIILVYSGYSFALLPPYYESVKEITAILNDPKVIEKIGSGRLITSIVKTEEGYILTARECTLMVKIVYLHPRKGFVGPAIFEIHSGELECKGKLPSN